MTMRAVQTSQNKVSAVALMNEQMEIVRNLTYENVGVQGSIPSGSLTHLQTLTRDGIEFTVTTIVRNIDHPFDGQIGSTTYNDFINGEINTLNTKNYPHSQGIDISLSLPRNWSMKE